MRIVAIVESDDCGPAAVCDSDFISIMKIDGSFIGASRCLYRGTPITCELSASDAQKLISKGVKCFDISNA